MNGVRRGVVRMVKGSGDRMNPAPGTPVSGQTKDRESRTVDFGMLTGWVIYVQAHNARTGLHTSDRVCHVVFTRGVAPLLSGQ